MTGEQYGNCFSASTGINTNQAHAHSPCGRPRPGEKSAMQTSTLARVASRRIATAAAGTLPASAPALRPALARLCARIDDAFEAVHASGASSHDDPAQHPAFARRMRAALAEAAAATRWLTDAERRGDPQTYCRHLLAADPLGRYTIVALVWRAGQCSPVHAHRTWCGYTVLEGTLTETLYDRDAIAGCAVEARRHRRDAGAVSFVRGGPHGIHRLGHDRASADAAAISLHVYGVPGEQIATHVNALVELAAPVPA